MFLSYRRVKASHPTAFPRGMRYINIIKRHDRNGIIEHVHRGQARYGDFSEVTDYREALDLVKNAQEEFMTIPSDIRKTIR